MKSVSYFMVLNKQGRQRSDCSYKVCQSCQGKKSEVFFRSGSYEIGHGNLKMTIKNQGLFKTYASDSNQKITYSAKQKILMKANPCTEVFASLLIGEGGYS